MKNGKRNHLGYRIGAWHPRAKHPDSIVRKAREMRARGKSYGQISQCLGVHPRTVADWVTRTTRCGLLVCLLAAPAIADTTTPPPGYWKFDAGQVFFCFEFDGAQACSQMPIERLRLHLIDIYGGKKIKT